MTFIPALRIIVLVACFLSIALTVTDFAMGKPVGWVSVMSMITMSFMAGFQAHTLLSLYTPATDSPKKG